MLDLKSYLTPVHKYCANILFSEDEKLMKHYELFDVSEQEAADAIGCSVKAVNYNRTKIITRFNNEMLSRESIESYSEAIPIDFVPVVILCQKSDKFDIKNVATDLMKLTHKPLGLITPQDIIMLGNRSHGFSWFGDEALNEFELTYDFGSPYFQELHQNVCHYNEWMKFCHYDVENRLTPNSASRIKRYSEYPFNLIRAIYGIKKTDFMVTLNKIVPLECDVESINECMDEILSTLTDREVDVIMKRFKEQMSLSQTGETIGRSLERVRQIEAKALRKLRHPSRTRRFAFVKDILFDDFNNALFKLMGGSLRNIDMNMLPNGVVPKQICNEFVYAMYKHIERFKPNIVFNTYQELSNAANNLVDIPAKHLMELYKFTHCIDFLTDHKVKDTINRAHTMLKMMSLTDQECYEYLTNINDIKVDHGFIQSGEVRKVISKYLTSEYDEDFTMKKAALIYDIENMGFDTDLVSKLLRLGVTDSMHLVEDVFRHYEFNLELLNLHVFDTSKTTMQVANQLNKLFLITTTEYEDLLDQYQEETKHDN